MAADSRSQMLTERGVEVRPLALGSVVRKALESIVIISAAFPAPLTHLFIKVRRRIRCINSTGMVRPLGEIFDLRLDLSMEQKILEAGETTINILATIFPMVLVDLDHAADLIASFSAFPIS